MADAEDRALKEALEAALRAADTADDTLVAAMIAECLWMLSRRAPSR